LFCLAAAAEVIERVSYYFVPGVAAVQTFSVLKWQGHFSQQKFISTRSRLVRL